MTDSIRLAVDAMGGDLGPRVALNAAYSLANHRTLECQLYGPFDILAELAPIPLDISQSPCVHELSNGSRMYFCHTDEVVTMEDRPGQALRHKQNSSMWLAVDAVRTAKADAAISAGNTGALMAMGRHLLKTFAGVDRPAIAKSIPTAKADCLMLDLGASVKCDSEHLIHNALMGSVFMESVAGVERPRVALLNIGSEDIKGNEQIRLAASSLQANEALNFIGYIEGDQIYRGEADVVVCDGFVGNVALKVSEGVAQLMVAEMREAFSSSWYGRLVGRFARPLLRKWQRQFDPDRYNGASFLGLQGPLIKSHGGADELAFRSALELACEQVNSEVAPRICRRFEQEPF
ncbi:phosphate acyltransferase PlsX [uncultured Pseudoteredinibacter sp.]|uniref:phosphate acyltransferase PlsX n=1 Tax=uncultured Pseudoteredinibacter sp. TaxID=1641701 RepID=UPI00263A0B83|nr:phosphate acyltransferase PlsX [uncultured Pseudoteredinibacter sp.]